MKKITFFSLAICTTLVIVWGIFALPLPDIASDTNKKAEQHFEKAVERIRQLMYEDAITELEQVITLVPKSEIAQDAHYWIGQAYYKAGKYDDALSTFEKLIEKYPESAIVPVTQLMVGRVQQAKENSKLRRAASDASDKGFIIDPNTGVKYTKTKTFVGKRDVIEWTTDLNLSPNGKFLLNGKLVVPLDGSDPFDLVDMPATRGTWSPDGKMVAFYSLDAIWVIPVSLETGRPTGSSKKLLDGKYRYQGNVSWSPDSKKVVFERWDKNIRSDIWTLSIKDGSLTQITSGPVREYGPVWSPDGKTIAYGKDYRNIWLSPAGGGTSRKIVDPGHKCYPFWSPDGKWIVWGNFHLFRLADKQKLEIIPPREVGSFFSWSPDGRKMLFYRQSYHYREALKVVSASGGPTLELGRHLTLWGAGPWSPDSKMIIAVGENEDSDIVFWIIPLSGGDPFLLEMDVSVDGNPFPFSVSRDVKKLAFTVQRDDGAEDLFVVPISLKEARTTGPAIKVFDGWYRGGGYNATASWSPSGRKLAVIHKGDIWIVYASGNKPVQITKTPEIERSPGWSPDGKLVKYVVNPSKERTLQLIPASGGKATKILDACETCTWSPNSKELAVSSKGVISIIPIKGGKTQQIAKIKDLGLDQVFALRWSHDGKYIACVGGLTVKGNSGPIFMIPVEGGKATELATDDHSWKYSVSWSPDGKWIAYGSEGSVKVRPEGTMWEADFKDTIKKLSE